MKVLILGGTTLFSLLIMGLLIAGQWTATTYSYSEKLVGTAIILLFAVPFTAVALYWINDSLD